METATERVRKLQQQLIEAYVQRDEASKKLEAAEEAIKMIRHVLAGVELGEQIAAESSPEDN